jgi:D-serine deaminase-like pyridoxal phosphate-dependent protein
LAVLGKSLGENSISVLVDSIDIVSYLPRYHELTGLRLGVFVKLDTGNNRAGLDPDSRQLKDLLSALHKLEQDRPSDIGLRGFYSHMGRSYGSDTISEVLDYLAVEIERCELGVIQASALHCYADRRFIIAVGATPTTTSAQNLTKDSSDPTVKRVQALIQRVQASHDIELHAGAYVTLDMQQLAAHARPATSDLSFDNLALSVLAEVASLYPHRKVPEALVACGQLCLGREPCRSYPGWGVLTPWQQDCQGEGTTEKLIGWYDPEGDRTGWIVDRLSQEHGILAWQGSPEKMRRLRIGEKVRIWPNHCCICVAGFSYLLVVDSSRKGAERDRVIDVWLSWRGW